MKKGALCSVNGGNYEKHILNILNKTMLHDKYFNTQTENELGGSTLSHDILCNFNSNKDLGIEIKICNSPDWVQCSLIYDTKWQTSPKSKLSPEIRDIFNNFIQNLDLYNGNIPPFMEKPITHEEWLDIKKQTDQWNDVYVDIPHDIIRKLYKAKGCHYIQISNYGLYHLGEDICQFNVPIFDIPQRLRIRTKIHTRKNKYGFCKLSITAAAQPINIKLLKQSLYSLDDVNKLPVNLIFTNDNNF